MAWAFDEAPTGLERSNTMSDEEKKEGSANITPQPDANKKQSTELSDEELKKVSGGGPTIELVSWSWSGTNASSH